MKKKIALLLTMALLVVFGLTACGGSGVNMLFGKELLQLTKQSDILVQLDNGSADVGVMDSIMANYYMTSDTNYSNKMMVLEGMNVAEEDYGIAAKKDNKALISKINDALIYLSGADTGTYKSVNSIASDFGLQSELLISGSTVNPDSGATDDSWTNIVTKKKVVIGYTVFAPIAFEKDSKLTGFDVELAREVFKYLDSSIDIEFTVITWSQKEAMLDNGSIDLVWNGMTITDARKTEMQVSLPYLANKQACVIRKADKDKYSANTLAAFFKKAKDAVVAVEAGSAAHDCMDLNRE